MAFWNRKISNSDIEMRDLIDDIKINFKFGNLSDDHSGSGRTKRWIYIHNNIKIRFINDEDRYSFYIDGDNVDLDLISSKLVKELGSFFVEMESKEKLLKNAKLFNKVITCRVDAEKYNM